MWQKNELTERLNLQWPIFQAPMGGIATPALAVAVSDAGGLGGLGLWGLSIENISLTIKEYQQASKRPVNVNYPIWEKPRGLSQADTKMLRSLQKIYDDQRLGPVTLPEESEADIGEDHLDLLQELRPEVLSFHFGVPDQDTLKVIQSLGIIVIASATTVREATFLENMGVDAIIAQGTEAGGHRGTFTDAEISVQPGLISLLPQIVDSVSVPVIAAGGIGDGRGIAASLMLGASAVQVGTAFLACDEANVQSAHRRALENITDESTVVTKSITGRPARFIKNKLVNELSKEDLQPLPFPTQSILTNQIQESGDPNYMSFYAGQSAALNRNLSAKELVKKLCDEADQVLRKFV